MEILKEMNESRLNHSLAVAQKMQRIVTEHPKDFNCTADTAFLVGFIHDVGYALTDNASSINHAKAGGIALRNAGFKHWREVFYHGVYQTEYASALLDLLNYADLTTSPRGEEISMEERVKDISERYGEKSAQTQNAKALANQLKNKFYILCQKR